MIGASWMLVAALGVAASQPAAPTSQPASRPAPTTSPTTLPATAAAGPKTLPTTAAGPTTWPAAVVALGDPARLLDLLSDPDWHIRRKAQDALVRAGEDAKPFIQKLIEQAANDEARKNAQAALVEIDQNRLTGPSYLTLHFKNAPAGKVFAEISRQCFTPLLTVPENLFQEDSLPKVSVDADHQPFWAVVPKICQQLGVDFRHFQGGTRLMRSGGMQTDGISQIDGAFLIVATQINYSRSRSFAGHAEQTQFGMQIAVYPEPKLQVLRGSGSINVDLATDDHGNSLVPQGAAGRGMWGGFMGFGGWSLFAPLQYPKNIGTRITRFKGNTAFVIQVESQKIEIPDLISLKPTTRLIYNMPVSFQDMKKVGDAWKLHIHVNQPNFGGADWQQFMEGVQNRMQVLDAEGNALDHRGMSTTSNNAIVDMTLDFARSVGPDGRPAGDPVRLVWEVPTKTREITVPIEFRDLPLFDEK
jgi:hypothetical protein